MTQNIMRLLLVAASVLGGLAALPFAQAQSPPEAPWRETGTLPDPGNYCIDPTRATTLLVSYPTPDTTPAPNGTGSYAFDWASGQLTRFAEQPFDSCDPVTGWLYRSDPGPFDTAPVYRFSLADPQPRRVERVPGRNWRVNWSASATDGTGRAYAHTDTHLFISDDSGLTWRAQSLPMPADASLAMVAGDSRALYQATSVQEGATLQTTIAFSPNGGATWERRGTVVSMGARADVYTFASRTAPVDLVKLAVWNEGIGPTVYLSSDGGRNFVEVGVRNAGLSQNVELLHTGDGVVRLTTDAAGAALSFSTDGGQTWMRRTLPAAPQMAPTGLLITQVLNAPAHLLLRGGPGTQWHSPDGGQSWQLLTTDGPVGLMLVTPYAPHSALELRHTGTRARDFRSTPPDFSDVRVRVLALPDVGSALTMPVVALGAPDRAFFPATGHTLGAPFQPFWEANGGLPQFGYPRTEPFFEVNPADGRVYLVQYFERARFEAHPEAPGTSQAVLLGRLGSELTADRRATGEVPFVPVEPPGDPARRFFPETGHTLDARFRALWERTGGLAVYGYPISEAFVETNLEDGQGYLVQYFERNRFEYHPEQAGTPHEVQRGLLGNALLRNRGWLR